MVEDVFRPWVAAPCSHLVRPSAVERRARHSRAVATLQETRCAQSTHFVDSVLMLPVVTITTEMMTIKTVFLTLSPEYAILSLASCTCHVTEDNVLLGPEH